MSKNTRIITRVRKFADEPQDIREQQVK